MKILKVFLAVLVSLALFIGEVFLFTTLYNCRDDFMVMLSFLTVPCAVFLIWAIIKRLMK